MWLGWTQLSVGRDLSGCQRCQPCALNNKPYNIIKLNAPISNCFLQVCVTTSFEFRPKKFKKVPRQKSPIAKPSLSNHSESKTHIGARHEGASQGSRERHARQRPSCHLHVCRLFSSRHTAWVAAASGNWFPVVLAKPRPGCNKLHSLSSWCRSPLCHKTKGGGIDHLFSIQH